MALDLTKHQRGGMRPNAGRKIKYPWSWLLSVQKEINILRKKRPGTTIKKALRVLEGEGALPGVDTTALARHLEKRRRLIRLDDSMPNVDLLSNDFSFEAGIQAGIKDLPRSKK
jgi:hypothetical protein